MLWQLLILHIKMACIKTVKYKQLLQFKLLISLMNEVVPKASLGISHLCLIMVTHSCKDIIGTRMPADDCQRHIYCHLSEWPDLSSFQCKYYLYLYIYCVSL